MAIKSRILFICHDGDLYGSQQSLLLLLRHLPKETYQCLVSVARPGPLQQQLEAIPHTVVLSHKRLQWVKHDPRTWLQTLGDWITLAITAIPRVWYLFNTIQREKINVVHTNSTVSLEGALAAALAGIPHVWHIRELFMIPSPKFHMTLGRHLSRWIIARFSDRVICISQAVRQQFEPYLALEPSKYELIYNALSQEAGPSSFPDLPNTQQESMKKALALKVLQLPNQPYFWLGYMGRISAGKGLHELLEALAILHRDALPSHLPIHLLVAGDFVDEPYRQRIHQLLQTNPLGDSVHFLGYQSHLEPFYHATDLLVVPSVQEPFGRVVIEAMAHDLPCIGADSGGIPEIIEEDVTGWLYPTGRPDILAQRIQELYQAPWKLMDIQQNARRMVYDRFNIKTQVRMLDECYQSILARHQLL